MNRLQITICHDGLVGPLFARIKGACDDWARVERICQMAPEQEFRSKVFESDIVVGWPKADWLVAGPTRLFQCGSTGYESYVGKGLETKSGFTMCNSAGTMSISVAEHGIALMLTGTRNLHRHAQDQVRRHFERHPPYREVFGTTACICGIGGIGTELAQRCRGLGMNVVGVRRNATRVHPLVSEVYPLSRLNDAVRSADHVFIALPLVAETRGCFNASVFAAMKRGASLYALARGAHIVERDLVAALESGQVGFAGLDVFTEEPLPPVNPLWNAPNLFITPHCSGRSDHEHERMCALVIENFQRFHAGEPLRNVVLQNP